MYIKKYIIVLIVLIFFIISNYLPLNIDINKDTIIKTKNIVIEPKDETITISEQETNIPKDYSNIIYSNNIFKFNEDICFDFIDNSMSKSNGVVFTNYLSTNSTLNYSTGHEILSESIGLIMLYAIRINDVNLFNNTYNYMYENLYDPDFGILWRSEMIDNTEASSNALLDDLRILRSLLEAKQLWQTDEYDLIINNLTNLTFNNLTNNNNLISYYSNINSYKTTIIEIGYLDLYTIKFLKKYDKRWNLIYDNSVEILKSSKLETIPLFNKSYNLDTKVYNIGKDINMLDSLISMLHLSEVNELENDSYLWLKNSFYTEDKLYGHYLLNGVPTYDYESSAVYALAARIANSENDNDFYNDIINKLIKLQIIDTESELYGSFGSIYNLEVFSYDNLQSLIAFRRKYEGTSN